MKKILVLVNPKARHGDQVKESITQWLETNGFSVLQHKENKKGISETILAHATEKPIVLVAGGDGSVNEALPALIETHLPLLLVPSGTANNLARTLNIPNDVEQALALLKTGELKTVDVGVVNKIPFINVVGLGLSTQVNRMVRSKLKKIFGVFAFVMTAMNVALRMSPFRIQVEYDGQVHRSFSWQVSICNGRNYGNGLVIHKDATLTDQLLHGLSTESKKWWHAFSLIPALISGRFKGESDVTTFTGKEVTLRTRRPMHVDVDGDIKTKTPLHISVLPKSLNIFTPHE